MPNVAYSNMYEGLLLDAAEASDEYLRAQESRRLELARDILEKQRRINAAEGLAAIFGFTVVSNTERDRIETSMKRLELAPLGQIAVFGPGSRNELLRVEALTDDPLNVGLSYLHSTRSVNRIQLSFKANIKNLYRDKTPGLDGYVADLGWVRREGLDVDINVPRVELLGDVINSFDLLEPDDEYGRRTMGRFFDRLLDQASAVEA